MLSNHFRPVILPTARGIFLKAEVEECENMKRQNVIQVVPVDVEPAEAACELPGNESVAQRRTQPSHAGSELRGTQCTSFTRVVRNKILQL